MQLNMTAWLAALLAANAAQGMAKASSSSIPGLSHTPDQLTVTADATGSYFIVPVVQETPPAPRPTSRKVERTVPIARRLGSSVALDAMLIERTTNPEIEP